MKAFAAHNADADIRHASSAGGIFTILAENTLKSGGVVFGVGYNDEWSPAHVCATDTDVLKAIRGSKYAFSANSAKAIDDAVKLLEQGKRLLFSGTPCQIATLKHRVGDSDILLTVETVCHGAPEAKYWQRYLTEILCKTGHNFTDITSVNFRDKRLGWKNYYLTITFADGTEFSQYREDNLYMRAFLQDYTLRDACFRCPFKYPHGSKADITLGDLWGITQMVPQIDNNLGTTLVIANSPKGEKALEGIEHDAELDLDTVAKYNPAIYHSSNIPAGRDAFIAKVKTTKNLTAIFRRFAGRPVSEILRIKAYRIKQRLLKIFPIAI